MLQDDRKKLEELLDEAVSISSKKGPARSITDGYCYTGPDSDKQSFEESYYLFQGQIYQILLDPKANENDDGESSFLPISKDIFLQWLIAEPRRVEDVTERLIDYNQEGRKNTPVNDKGVKETMEAMFRYF